MQLQPPTIRKKVSVANGSRVNVFADEDIARLPASAYMHVGVSAAAAGLLADIKVGGQYIAVGAELPNLGAAFPQFPNQFVGVNYMVQGGVLNSCHVSNNTGGAVDVYIDVRASNTPTVS